MSLDDVRRKKLKFRAWHRGFVEADLILGPFADTHLPAMDARALDDFEVLLDQADQDLYAWIIGQCETPAEFQGPVMDQIRAFRFTARTARQAFSGEVDTGSPSENATTQEPGA